jgi:hypothetical protein
MNNALYSSFLMAFSFAKNLARAQAKALLGLFIFYFSHLITPSAQPGIQWQKSFGGTASEVSRSIENTNDGGYIVAGFSTSNNGDVSGNHGGGDWWVVKLNVLGEIQWQRTLGGTSTESVYSILQTSDGGYIAAGRTHSNDGDVSGNHGDWDCWVVKLTSMGVVEWQKTYGGSNWDEAYFIQQTTEGGYILAGNSVSTDGDVTGNHGYFDIWVVKLNQTGTIEWQKSLGGGNGAEYAQCVRQTIDGGYIVAGSTNSTDGDVSGNNGTDDYWVVKLSPAGTIEWQNALGGLGIDVAHSICQASDDGYVVVGHSGSDSNGDVTGHHGGFDAWVVKLSNAGDLQWQKALGGSGPDWGFSIQPTNDGGYVISGETQSTDGDVLDNDGGADAWVIKLGQLGEIQWQKTFGGAEAEGANVILQTNDGGYITAGYTYSNNGDVSGNHGGRDIWVVKLSPSSTPTSSPLALPLEIYPNPATNTIYFLSTGVLTKEESGADERFTVTITDLLGWELSRQTISDNNEIDISTLPNGLYLLTASTPSGKMFCGKFRKE